MELQADCSGAFWVTVNVPENSRPGTAELGLELTFFPYRSPAVPVKLALPVTVYDAVLPRRNLPAKCGSTATVC